MPSIFEPCGIGQMIALRYGTVPIVRETGGLKDTVKPFNKYDSTGNGYTFANINAHDLLYCIKRALTEYDNIQIWNMLQNNAIRSNFDWKQSASEYIDMYKQLLA